jgi:3-hydroxyacyl-[acyl-carrier-protein] dehydratase
MTKTLDIQKIREFLPHRYPFLLVDKVTAYKPNEYITAIKNVTFNEPCFQGHFPENPIFPGVLIIEAMAQAAALLGVVSMEEEPGAGTIYYLVGVDKTRFKKTVHPGDQIMLNVKFIKLRRNIWRFSAIATVDEKLVASAELLTTVADS